VGVEDVRFLAVAGLGCDFHWVPVVGFAFRLAFLEAEDAVDRLDQAASVTTRGRASAWLSRASIVSLDGNACSPQALSMTAEGRPYARFRRALAVRNVMQAETAAREMRGLPLLDAVDLCSLMAVEAPDRYGRAALRLFRRLVQEREALTLDDAELAIACLRALPRGDRDRLTDVLRGLAGGRQSSRGHWR